MGVSLLKPIELLLTAFAVSFITSQGGISGAYLLLPIQSYILGTTNPMISSTNLMYNLISIPLSIHRYIRERRLAAPFTLMLITGSVIGTVVGVWLRGHYLVGGYVFSYFMGSVLLLLSMELALSSLLVRQTHTYEITMQCRHAGLSLVIITNRGNTYRVSTPLLLIIAALVGIVGGAYGIGGASILSPILMGPMELSPYVISGPTLIVTFAVSIIGVVSYTYLGYPPDLINGLFMGLGGMAGIYLGTITQRRLPERYIKLMVAAVTVLMGLYSMLYASKI